MTAQTMAGVSGIQGILVERKGMLCIETLRYPEYRNQRVKSRQMLPNTNSNAMDVSSHYSYSYLGWPNLLYIFGRVSAHNWSII